MLVLRYRQFLHKNTGFERRCTGFQRVVACSRQKMAVETPLVKIRTGKTF